MKITSKNAPLIYFVIVLHDWNLLATFSVEKVLRMKTSWNLISLIQFKQLKTAKKAYVTLLVKVFVASGKKS